MNINKFLLLFISLLFNNFVYALQHGLLNNEWNSLSEEQYFENRMQCHKLLEEFYSNLRTQSKYDVNSKNTQKKYLTNTEIQNKVLDSLKMEKALYSEYNIEINNAMLQADINRMLHNTKDKQKLNELFKLLKNNPNTIAECISRPFLVKNKLINQHKSNHNENEELKQLLLSSIKENVSTNNYVQPPKDVFQFTYVVDNDQNELLNENENIIILNAHEFTEKLDQRNLIASGEETKLQENEHSFFVENVIDHSELSIKTEVKVWKKISFDSWWEQKAQTIHDFKTTAIASNLKSIQFTDIKVASNNNSETNIEKWQEFIPDPRYKHTAIWTGSEMIIWGGVSNGAIFHGDGAKYNPITDIWTLLSMDNAPSARAYHSAIWTGTEMIIWGGRNFSTTFSNGKKYNLITNSWTDVSSIGAPIGKTDHQAFWTEEEMIIWGGNVANGSIYNPISDMWTPITSEFGPSPRKFSTAVWTGSELIVWGGRSNTNSQSSLNTGAKFSLITNTWSPLSLVNAPEARYRHLSVWSGTEMLIWGSASNSDSHKFGGRYNPELDTWTTMSITNQPLTSSYHTLIWAENVLITYGGLVGSLTYNKTGVYNPTNDTWQTTSDVNIPHKRSQHTAIWTGTDMIVWGGTNSGAINSGGKYNVENNSWTLTNEAIGGPPSNVNQTSVWTGAEMIVWGGSYWGEFDLGGIYNPITDQWTSTTTVNAPSARRFHTAVWTGSEMIVWGGGDISTNTGAKYSPLTNSWSTTTNSFSPSARSYHSSIWTGEKMIIWGGKSAGLNVNTGGIYNPETNSWTVTTILNAPLGRSFHTATWTGEEMIIWAGELSSNNYTNTGGIYDPNINSWDAIDHSITTPNSRANHTSIWTGSTLIAFGGDGSPSTGTKYNPIDGTIENFNSGIETRISHTAVWTGDEMIVWGGDNRGYIRTGGIYNPNLDSWRNTSLIGAPSGRDRHSAVWTGNNMLIWGGYTSSSLGAYYADVNYDLIFSNDFENLNPK